MIEGRPFVHVSASAVDTEEMHRIFIQGAEEFRMPIDVLFAEGDYLEPDVTFVQRWPRGIPAYSPGHLAMVDGIFARVARFPGLHLNCNAYRGVAMNDCARESRELALRIATRQ